MAGQGNLIVATDYNAIQSKIALILGSGSGDQGYGQSVLSSSVAANAKISITQWANLRSDILRARQHQTNTDLTGSLTTPGANVKISESDRAAYDQMATDATTNRLITPAGLQATRENLVSAEIRTAAWNGTVKQTITVDFVSSDSARYYFNTGSRIEFSSAFTNTDTDGPLGKGASWNTLLSGMETIYFNYDSTVSTKVGGTGITNSAYGYSNLPATDTVIFTKAVSGSTYYPNVYRISARKPTLAQLIFTIEWKDDATDSGHGVWGVDENVQGTLASYVQVYRANGTNVQVTTPPASKTTIG